MSSRRVGNASAKGKGVSQSNPKFEQLAQGVANVNLGSGQDEGQWEVYSKKTKNKGGSSAPKQRDAPPAHNSNPRAWGNADMARNNGRNHGGAGRGAGNPWQPQNANYMRPAGRGSGRSQIATGGYDYNNVTSNPIIRPPLENGWNWKSTQPNVRHDIVPEVFEQNDDENDDEVDDDCDDLEDTDDDLMSDEYDSDVSQKSHETRKKNRWFNKFFQNLDNLTVEQINEPERQWHCPACQGGPGAIDWYNGLQPLMNHAKTKGSKRVKVHRELAALLDEELRRRGTTVVPAGEVFGKWKGLKDGEKDHEIIWPPMVIIQNTKLEQDENDKV
ncbi:protein suppressor of gene silencing 3-like [Trifolium pratense]|uniref:Protein suppressor of gene silencing 3-like n=1 Tax=Trifolium pratense TaxID=57577 RepID=A0A2K3LVY3_TRIPR|nr:protein suppressor of gene silencing 3-like [Trifolium pratense]